MQRSHINFLTHRLLKHPGFCQTHIFIRTAGIADGTVVRIDGKQNSGIVKFPERIVCKTVTAFVCRLLVGHSSTPIFFSLQLPSLIPRPRSWQFRDRSALFPVQWPYGFLPCFHILLHGWYMACHIFLQLQIRPQTLLSGTPFHPPARSQATTPFPRNSRASFNMAIFFGFQIAHGADNHSGQDVRFFFCFFSGHPGRSLRFPGPKAPAPWKMQVQNALPDT